MPEDSIPVKELHQFLSSLGLRTVEFQRTIQHKQLLNFISTLLDWRMHIDGMKLLRSQLEELETFQEGTVAPVVFLPSSIYTYKLFAVLLETSLKNILSEKVLEALLEDPQDPLIEGVGPLLDLSVFSHFQFLISYLTHAHLASPPLAIKMAAGEIVLAFLQNTSEEEKGLPWLSKTIASTSVMRAKGMKEMLERIIKEKKMGVVPSWPRSCRKVAESTLKAFGRYRPGICSKAAEPHSDQYKIDMSAQEQQIVSVDSLLLDYMN